MELNRIYNEDCLEGMKRIKSGSVDLLLTDPPYNISVKNNFKTMGRAGIDFGEWDKEFNQEEWIKSIKKLLSKNGSAIIFNDWKNLGDIARSCEKEGLVIKDMLRWEKTNPMPRNRDRRYITDFECAVWVTNKNAKWVFNRQSESYQRPSFLHNVVGGKEKNGHPTQKPIKLMEDLIKIHSNEGDIVFDPFIGSGTTAIAAINTNRNFIGFELDETYFDLANERIKENVKEAVLE